MNSERPFESVIAAHGATVLRVCRAVLGSTDADDASSETVLAAMKAYSGLDPDNNLKAWLITIAHRKAIDIARADDRRRTILTAQVPDVAAPRELDGHDSELMAPVTRLPDKQRQAVAYHYLAGLPYAEVAAITGGSTEAARRAAAGGGATLRRTYPGLTTRRGNHSEHQ